ncbi:hypothetical_protein (plasmid) [Leishmania braziliensis MHOM/BR/75/M2904]|uniref:Hypothetical_protein n=1 Tax=Leishmania braziliensis MHOM/BR/75/M2904 TaxID=420245 RepID=A0A3P3YXB6_LEIBR|nr:hypothetical_protein [Leishmania braziliensis MHOM/BR/75/M2904]
MPIGGNTTLILYAPDSSQLVYLSGYGIEHDGRLRFGAHCEETMPPPAPFSSQAGVDRGGGVDLVNFTSSGMADYLQHVAARQMLANTRLYTDPLPIDDDNVYRSSGMQVLLSTTCSYNSHGIPLLTASVSNMLTLTKRHTGMATPQRLHMCIRDPEAAVVVAAVCRRMMSAWLQNSSWILGYTTA